MNPKEKANEILHKMLIHQVSKKKDCGNVKMYIRAKECALICVDEILNGAHVWNKIEGKDRTFWNEVKIEIQNL